MRSNIKLPALHRVFQAAMGWTNSHLHEFVINGVRYAAPDPEWEDELQQADERGVALDVVLGRGARSFDYVYDFGDHWHHAVLVESTRIQPQAGFNIQCTTGENACPPEDVGGAPGYAGFLEAIADPRHEEHANYLAWRGGGFDPARFDRAAVNRALGKIGAG
ncbi:MAG: plasmid pRiA4b ORF-3 family protein [Pseudomonadota bacterium]|nr:plasmid pRiA4b ORF-3 family protein [Pseudomonadota bacterium]